MHGQRDVTVIFPAKEHLAQLAQSRCINEWCRYNLSDKISKNMYAWCVMFWY